MMSNETPRQEPSIVEKGGAPDRKAAPQTREEEGVFELTEALAEDGSVRRLAPAAGGEGTASALTAGAAAAAFAGLASLGREKRREGETALGAPGKTLEDILRELLRPLVQAWLDANLAQIVERLVREEIQRVVRDAGLR